jgi:hypothetical protein
MTSNHPSPVEHIAKEHMLVHAQFVAVKGNVWVKYKTREIKTKPRCFFLVFFV